MIDPNDKKRIKEIFSEFLDLSENRGETTKEINTLKKEASSILDVKSPIVTKLFSYLKKLMEEGTDELSDLKYLADEIND